MGKVILTLSLGIGLLLLGGAILVTSLRDGMTNEELLARLDQGEPGFFEPVALGEGRAAATLAAVSSPTATGTPEPTETAASAPTVTPTATPEPMNEAATAVPSPTPTHTPTASPTPTETPTPPPAPVIPTWLRIPAIGLDAPVVPVEPMVMYAGENEYRQWQAPDRFAAGWHNSSAMINQPGNIVLNGHVNIYGEVFRYLERLKVGDVIYIGSEGTERVYVITNTMILPEKGEPLETRIRNASWILPSQDDRLTLITCWPYESNTHRLIVVAVP